MGRRSVSRVWTFVAAAAVMSCSGDGGEAVVTSGGATTVVEPTTEVTVPPTSTPASTSTATTEPEATAPPTFASPEQDDDLERYVDDVAGFRTVGVDAGTVPWPMLELPSSAAVMPLTVMSGSDEVGTIVVADRLDFGSYVERLFDDEVAIVTDVDVHDGELLLATNEARALWRDVGGRPVIAMTVPEVGDGMWAWEHDDRAFIAVGRTELEDYVAGLVQAQQAAKPADPYDAGELSDDVDRDIFVPGYTYADYPVRDALATMAVTAVGDCADDFYAGYVVAADDPDPAVQSPEDLSVVIARVAQVCRDGGFFDQLPGSLQAQGLTEAAVGGEVAWQDATRLVHVDGDTVIQLGGNDPESFSAMRPFVERLIAGTEPAEILDLTPLPIPTCIYRVPPPPGGDPQAQPSYAVDCATPHQGELYHHGQIGGDTSASYPGDEAVDAEASQQCLDAFGPFVGVDFESSQFNYLYFFPSAPTWLEGDRGVECVLYTGDGTQLRRGSAAGTGQ